MHGAAEPEDPDRRLARDGRRAATRSAVAAGAAAALAVARELGADAVELVARQHVGLAELGGVPVLRGPSLCFSGRA